MEVVYKNEKVLVEVLEEISLGKLYDYNSSETQCNRNIVCLKWKVKGKNKYHYTLSYDYSVGCIHTKEIYERYYKDIIEYGTEIDYKLVN